MQHSFIITKDGLLLLFNCYPSQPVRECSNLILRGIRRQVPAQDHTSSLPHGTMPLNQRAIAVEGDNLG